MRIHAELPLEEVCTIVGGGTPRRSDAAFFGGSIPWATPTDVTALEGSFIEQTRETITPAGLRGSSARLVPAGTVLMTSRATIGYTAVAAVPMATNQGFANLICGNRLLPEYLAFWLQGQRGHFIQLAGGTTFKELPKSTLKKVRIPLPPLDEQRRIVDILNRAARIETLRRRAAERLREFVPALFVRMFGDPAENPMAWPQRRVGDLCNVQGGLQVTKKRNVHPLETPYLRVANVLRDRLVLDDIKLIRLTEAELTRTRLLRGDLLIVEGHGNAAEIGRVAVWNGQIETCVHQNHLIRARPDRTLLVPGFAAAYLNSSSGRQHLLRRGKTTSGLTTITTSDVKDCTILAPPVGLQRRFSTIITQVRAMLSTIELGARTSVGLSATLMARLLPSGGNLGNHEANSLGGRRGERTT